MNRPIIPPLTNEDYLPHDRAVWRDYHGTGEHAAWGTNDRAVSVDYGDGQIAQGISPDGIDWPNVKRWRFGWAPQGGAA